MKRADLLDYILVFFICWMFADIAHAQVTASITVSPISSDKPVAPTITWSSSGADTCTATDGWSGTKSPSGTITLALLTKSTKFGLTCIGSQGKTTLNWTLPLKNTDETALTNLKGFQLWNGSSVGTLSRNIVVNNPAAISADVLSPTGVQVFSISTITTSTTTNESAQSSAVSKTVTGDSVAVSATMDITVRPLPPSNLNCTGCVPVLTPPN